MKVLSPGIPQSAVAARKAILLMKSFDEIYKVGWQKGLHLELNGSISVL